MADIDKFKNAVALKSEELGILELHLPRYVLVEIAASLGINVVPPTSR